MAKRHDLNISGPGPSGDAGSPTDSKEQRLVAFAEQLGWIAGTIQGKAEGWLNSEALTAQISKVRDSATALPDQLRPAQTAQPRQASGANTSPGGATDNAGGSTDKAPRRTKRADTAPSAGKGKPKSRPKAGSRRK